MPISMSEPGGANAKSASRVTARAPGRLDVMGGIADYSGSLVLQMPLAVATSAHVGLTETGRYEAVSEGSGGGTPPRRFAVSSEEAREILRSYDSARTYFADRKSDHWASYVLGCLSALLVEEDVALPRGLSIRITSDVPEGKGISSSAALEVSVMGALNGLLHLELSPERLAHLCQIVENRVAGAPCGIMDQMTAACGRKDHLLRLLCQPAELQGHLALPPVISIWGIDSGLRHSVGGSDYGTVRTAAAMGYRIIAGREGLPVERISTGRVAISDDRFGGYLSNLGLQALSEHLPSLPKQMPGAEFLEAFDGTADDTVSVVPSRVYPVRAATAYPVHEHERSIRFATLLASEPTEKTLAMMGELMYLSHAGYSTCGLGSPGTDRIVELVKEAGYHSGLFGARGTGGGSGGTVAILASSSASGAVHQIARQYARESGNDETVFEGSSDGLTLGNWE